MLALFTSVWKLVLLKYIDSYLYFIKSSPDYTENKYSNKMCLKIKKFNFYKQFS